MKCLSLPPFEIHLKIRNQNGSAATDKHRRLRQKYAGRLKHEKNGLVEPTQSLWNSPILLVKMANGSYSICIDFRKVNQVTSSQYQPLVSVEEVVDVLGKKKPRIFQP